jgi:putative transposase
LRPYIRPCITKGMRPPGPSPAVRSDNGLIFEAGVFVPPAAIVVGVRNSLRLIRPKQNGLVERFFRSLKEECVWQHNFASLGEAGTAHTRWIEWYNAERPHQARGYRPRQFRALQPQLVA